VSVTRSPKDRAGTPKRVCPPQPSIRSQEKGESQTPSRGSIERGAKSDYVFSEERKESWKRLGYEYYNGELMTREEAQELRNALKLSLESSEESEANRVTIPVPPTEEESPSVASAAVRSVLSRGGYDRPSPRTSLDDR
jgi:hypothetical protein